MEKKGPLGEVSWNLGPDQPTLGNRTEEFSGHRVTWVLRHD